ncbi:MAG: hypothetical protein DRI65_09460 [Chloroflexota bacterium]|nr:MAG: hypothetical protein DRI65_09460 [Chloroflexota bacterium]HDD61205.1 hypothetical protein [Chloroflexota bacterium]
MNRVIKFRFRILALLALAVILSAATYGFAAANNVPAGVSGEGTGAISGYTVSNVNYFLDSNDPTQFDHVTFTLDANATDVYGGIGNGTIIYWTSCTGGPTNFSCDLTGSSVSVAGAIELHVSSVQ